MTKFELPAAVSKVELTVGPPISPAALNAPDHAEIKSPPSPSPLAQILANVLSRSYRLARDARKRENLASFTRQFLNAAGVRLDGTYLAHTDFKDACRSQASFRGTNLSSALLTGAVLEGSNMSDADLTEAELVGANLRFVDFTRTDLTGAGLDGADIERADFTQATMKKITMIGGTAAGANFSYADLTNASFEGVNFCPTEPDGRQANPEAAKSLESATFKDVKGLSEKQVISCKEKGAKFVADSNLTITSVIPGSGFSSGGSKVTITGVNFKEPKVKFGSVSVRVASVEGSTVIHVLTPPHKPQTVDITVINIDGKTATMKNGFTYV